MDLPRGWRAALLRRLSRRTRTGRLIAEVDGLRFVSILLVVGFHLAGYVAASDPASAGARSPLFRVLGHGHHGVSLFFMISGFVLGLPFARHYLAGGEPVRLRPFLRRRLTRLEPPYVLSMLLLFPAVAVTRHIPIPELLPHLLASLTYTHNLAYGEPSPLNVVAWSLEVEVQFYLLAPLLAMLAFRRRGAAARRAGLGAAAAMIVCARLAGWAGPPLTLLWSLEYFLGGLLLADLFITAWRTPSRRPAAWDALWLACWPALWMAWEAPRAAGAMVLPVVMFALFAATVRGRRARAILSNPWLATIGGMCYTIYLVHYPLISLAGRMTMRLSTGSPTLDLLVQSALLLPLILIVSAIGFVLVERPCMDPSWPSRLRDRLFPRRDAVPAESER